MSSQSYESSKNTIFTIYWSLSCEMYEKDINQVFQSVIATRSSYVKSFKFMFSVRRAKIPNFEVIIWTLDRETFTDSFNYLRLCLLAVFHTLQIVASPELISIQGIID